ncbi:hypothetical protein C1645_834169 [Glomus cerebriforme]|uniref:Uncharacterized protein n=1 Tax=Glomus cerebriforme TaxID=658196 RepID=A0A397SCH0_9GLOM|nr:hypothetical protein C1645_834169 [Glomus cerebriforme]
MSFQNNLLNKEPFNCEEYVRIRLKQLKFNKYHDIVFKRIKKYPTQFDNDDAIYGISQKPDTKDYIMNNFVNGISGNQIIDDFIQEKQLKFKIVI